MRPNSVRLPPSRIVERHSTAPLTPGTKLVERALDYIRANAMSPISARNVAGQLGVSMPLLALRFRECEKTTVRESIIAHRLGKVEELLRETGIPIGEISRKCGFGSANRLTHLFTARYGLSPREWRRQGAGRNRERL